MGTVCKLGKWHWRAFGFQVLCARRSGRQAPHSSAARGNSQRSVRTWGKYHAALAVVHTCSAHAGIRLSRQDLYCAGRRWNIYRCKHHACHLSMEFSYPLAPVAAMVSGSRRAHIHHAQISARRTGASRNTRWNVCLEFFAARWRGSSLFHPPEAVNRRGRERYAHLIGIAGRQQSRRKRQYSSASRLHALEVMQPPRFSWTEFVRKGTRRK